MSGSLARDIFPSVQGQMQAKELLSRAVESDRLASAYLFRGPAGIGKFAAALDFVKFVKCGQAMCDGSCRSCRLVSNLDHPDLDVLLPLPGEISESPEKTGEVLSFAASEPFAKLYFDKPASISIDAIRELSERLALAADSPGGRWAIIRDGDAMNIHAANAFLKTLEEPPDEAHIVITSSRPDFLLPTILSRTQVVNFTRLSRSKIASFLVARGIDSEKAARIALIADGSIATAITAARETSSVSREFGERIWTALFTSNDKMALEIAEELNRNRSLAQDVLDSTTAFLRDHIFAQLGLKELIRNPDKIERLESAAKHFQNPKPLGEAIKFLNFKSDSLKLNPQYELFWLDLIFRGRKIIKGEEIYREN